MEIQSDGGADKRGADSGAAPCSVSVERTTRTVIEHKLLTALEDDNTVAALLSKQDLEDFIFAMHRSLAQADWDKVRMERMYGLLKGMKQLRDEAFPPNESSSATAKGAPEQSKRPAGFAPATGSAEWTCCGDVLPPPDKENDDKHC